MPIVKFVNENKEIEVPDGANLRKEAKKAGVNLYYGFNGFGKSLNKLFNCHGLGMCATCRVNVVNGAENCSPMSTWEKVQFKSPVRIPVPIPDPLPCLAYVDNEDTMRLACLTKVHGDIEVETNPQIDLFGENFFS